MTAAGTSVPHVCTCCSSDWKSIINLLQLHSCTPLLTVILYTSAVLCSQLKRRIRSQAEDHDSSAMWLGKQLQCHLQPMEQLQQHVATEVQAGKDAAALLWRFA